MQNYLPGHLAGSGDAQYLLRDDEENPDGTVNQLAGTFNTTLFKVEPRWKARLGVAYAQDAWGINVDERYLGGVKNDAPGLCLNDNPGGCDYTATRRPVSSIRTSARLTPTRTST